MVTVTVGILQDEESNKYVTEFNNNILERQVSNIMFKDDSFIKFVHKDIVIIYLNTMIPRELPFILMIISFIVGFVFHIALLVGVGSGIAGLMLVFEDIILYVFFLGLRKQGFKGKIKRL